jgi:alkanesulfonate monooxygenase SsuD/methylene tetrahydromethanopterin reductase-like flavin-dependent oxidoreductase (luciferase family)
MAGKLIRFGVWDHFERRPGIPAHDQYQQKIALLQAAERLNFYAYHLAEHHLSPLDLAPSPNVFLAALAHATERLHIGTMVHILPLYHPVRLVQELCMLDNLSGGRLEIGVGRGIRSVEHEWFGMRADEARDRHDEVLAIVVRALSTGNAAYAGRFYTIPDAPLDLRPVQKPYPPLWYAGGVDFAGRHRLNFLGRTAEDVERYWRVLDEHRADPDLLNPGVDVPLAGITKHVVIRRTYAEALSLARRAWPVFQRNWGATSLRMPNGRVARANEDFDSVLAENARLLIGTPRMVAEYVEQCLERLADRPSFYFAPAFHWGDLTPAESLESMQLFVEAVAGQVAVPTRSASSSTT